MGGLLLLWIWASGLAYAGATNPLADENGLRIAARRRTTPAWCLRLTLNDELAKKRPPRQLTPSQLERFYSGALRLNGDAAFAAAIQRLEVLVETYLVDPSMRARTAILKRIRDADVPWPTLAAVLVHGRRYPTKPGTGFQRVKVALDQIEGGGFDLLLKIPEDYDPGKRAYPLIVYFHASYGNGEAIKNLVFPKEAIIAAPTWPMRYPPLCHAGRELMWATIEAASARYRIASDQVSVTGHSVGGSAAYACGLWYSDRFAALAPNDSLPPIKRHTDGFANLRAITVVLKKEMGEGPRGRDARFRKRLREEKINLKLIDPDQEPDVFAASMRQLIACKRTRVPRRLYFTTPMDIAADHYWLRVDRWERRFDDPIITVGLTDVTKSSLEAAKKGKAHYVETVNVRAKPSTVRARADLETNTITINSVRVMRLSLKLMPGLYDPARPLKVVWNGRIVHQRRVRPSRRTILEEAGRSGRRDRVVLAVVPLTRPLPRR